MLQGGAAEAGLATSASENRFRESAIVLYDNLCPRLRTLVISLINGTIQSSGLLIYVCISNQESGTASLSLTAAPL